MTPARGLAESAIAPLGVLRGERAEHIGHCSAAAAEAAEQTEAAATAAATAAIAAATCDEPALEAAAKARV